MGDSGECKESRVGFMIDKSLNFKFDLGYVKAKRRKRFKWHYPGCCQVLEVQDKRGVSWIIGCFYEFPWLLLGTTVIPPHQIDEDPDDRASNSEEHKNYQVDDLWSNSSYKVQENCREKGKSWLLVNDNSNPLSYDDAMKSPDSDQTRQCWEIQLRKKL